jgi:DNA-binding NtrC family response regulator
MNNPSSSIPLSLADVLVVDDDYALSEAISQLLTRKRSSGAHGIRRRGGLETSPPSRRPRVQSSTTSCPATNGLALAAELRAELPTLHII